MYSSICGLKMTVTKVLSLVRCQVTNGTTAQSRKITKDLWREKKNDLTISTFMVLVDVPTQAQTCTLQSHHGMQQKRYTLKQRNTHSHPHIYTVLCMHAHKLTQRDRFTLSAHFFGMSIRPKSIWIELNTIKISKQT